MGLLNCPDCQKEISDSASTCIGCGRSMASAKEPAFVQNVKDTVVVERKGGKFELTGTLLILASMGGCAAAMVSSSSDS